MIKIEFAMVGKRFATRCAPGAPFTIRNLNLRIASGEVVSIIGPSGCGKSTLLNMGAGRYLPTQGEVHVGGVAWAEGRVLHYLPKAHARAV